MVLESVTNLDVLWLGEHEVAGGVDVGHLEGGPVLEEHLADALEGVAPTARLPHLQLVQRVEYRLGLQDCGQNLQNHPNLAKGMQNEIAKSSETNKRKELDH